MIELAFRWDNYRNVPIVCQYKSELKGKGISETAKNNRIGSLCLDF